MLRETMTANKIFEEYITKHAKIKKTQNLSLRYDGMHLFPPFT